MRRFLLGLIVGVVIVFAGLVITVFALGRLFTNRQPVIPANAVLQLDLTGNVPESAPVELPVPFLDAQSQPTVRDVFVTLRAAASDNRVKAILLQPHDLSIGWAKLEELRRDVLEFRRSGKPVYAFLQGAGSKEYYLASSAERIFVTPDDFLNVKGFRVEETFLKNALDRFGIGVQVDHIGRYKDAGDSFSRTGMTAETREVINQILDQLYGDFCQTVGESRHKTSTDVKTLVDLGPFSADQAKAVGLVDELSYEDQVFAALKTKVGVSVLNRVKLKPYARSTTPKGDRIAFLVGEGDILRGVGDNNMGNEAALISGAFAAVVRQVREDSSVKGVILRVDSPGGDAVASDEILHELKLLSARKPLVISMSDVAASGGYFISMTGDPVLAYPNTITGSIGVLYVRPNFHGLLDKIGVTRETIARGKLATIDALSEPLSDAGVQKLHDSIDKTYHSFVGKVAAARKKNYDQIDALAQGRVWMGTQASQNGLVDQTGGLNEAIAQVRRRAKLDSNGPTNLVAFPPRRSLLQVLSDSQSNSEVWTADAAEKTLRSRIPGLPGIATLRGGLLEVLPFRLSVE